MKTSRTMLAIFAIFIVVFSAMSFVAADEDVVLADDEPVGEDVVLADDEPVGEEETDDNTEDAEDDSPEVGESSDDEATDEEDLASTQGESETPSSENGSSNGINLSDNVAGNPLAVLLLSLSVLGIGSLKLRR